MSLVPWRDGPQFWIWRSLEHAAEQRGDPYMALSWCLRLVWEVETTKFHPSIGTLFDYPGRY